MERTRGRSPSRGRGESSPYPLTPSLLILNLLTSHHPSFFFAFSLPSFGETVQMVLTPAQEAAYRQAREAQQQAAAQQMQLQQQRAAAAAMQQQQMQARQAAMQQQAEMQAMQQQQAAAAQQQQGGGQQQVREREKLRSDIVCVCFYGGAVS